MSLIKNKTDLVFSSFIVLDNVHTCLIVLSALFRQNHQRPDFFGIFSFTQASSVA